MLRLAIAGILAMASTHAQAPSEFEVASVKPNLSGGDGWTINYLSGGRFAATNVTLKALIQSAFDVKDFEITGGPRWLDADSYDVSAEAESGAVSDEDLRFMLQGLLASRFQLKFHRETKELAVCSLTAAKARPKLTASTSSENPSGRTLFGAGKATITATKMPTARLAEMLGQILKRIVIDNTGLKGDYDFKLEWVPDQTADSSGPSIFAAIQEQLGLKLESTKGPVPALVIDSAEKASEN